MPTLPALLVAWVQRWVMHRRYPQRPFEPRKVADNVVYVGVETLGARVTVVEAATLQPTMQGRLL